MLPGVEISPVGTGGGATGGEGRTTSFVREAGLTSSCVIAPDWNLSRTVVLLVNKSLNPPSQVRAKDGRPLIPLPLHCINMNCKPVRAAPPLSKSGR